MINLKKPTRTFLKWLVMLIFRLLKFCRTIFDADFFFFLLISFVNKEKRKKKRESSLLSLLFAKKASISIFAYEYDLFTILIGSQAVPRVFLEENLGLWGLERDLEMTEKSGFCFKFALLWKINFLIETQKFLSYSQVRGWFLFESKNRWGNEA